MAGNGGTLPGGCPQGFHRNPVTNKCDPNDPNFCPVGTIWDSEKQRCVPDPAYQPPGNPSGGGGGGGGSGPEDGPSWPGTKVCPDKDGNCPPGYAKKFCGPGDIDSCLPPGSLGGYCCVKIDVPPRDPETGCCSEASLCDGMTQLLEAIVKTQQEIADILKSKNKDCSDLIDDCKDELEKVIKENVDKELKKFAKCQEQAKQGLCGTTEYLTNCAKYELADCENKCYQEGIGNIPGPCKGCGKEPCCCKDGKCEPCGEENEDTWFAWCDPSSGMFVVNQDGENPPSPNYRLIASGKSQGEVYYEAEGKCTAGWEPPVIQPPETPVDIPANITTVGCDILGYTDGRNVLNLAESVDGNSFDIAFARFVESTNNIGVAGLTIENLGQIVQSVMSGVMGAPPALIKEFTGLSSKLIGCNDWRVRNAMLSYSTFGMVSKLTGADLSFLASPYIYGMNSFCRNRFLDQDKAISAWLANAIDDKTLDAQWAIHGLCPESVLWYKEAARAKPVPLELATMQMRGLISESDYYAGMRRLGYTDRKDSTNLLKLRQQIPTMSDIIRFMVRDADDDTLVKKFDLDSGFDQKYRQQLKKWSEQQGVSEQQARYSWRAHWQIPSPTQLFQFWRRLRKDKKFGGEQKLWDDIGEALIQQDILPYWHDHYKAVSYQPLGRVDIRRMLNIASIKEDELEPLYQQLGYSDDDAKGLAKFAIRDRDAAIGRQKPVKLWLDALISRQEAANRLVIQGYPQDSVDKALDIAQYDFDSGAIAQSFVAGQLDKQQFNLKLTDLGVDPNVALAISNKLGYRRKPGCALREYHAGLIDRNTAEHRLQLDGLSQQAAVNYLDDSDCSRRVLRATNCTAAIKREFITGGKDKQEAETALINAGIMPGRAAELVSDWGCEQLAKGKAVAVNILCKWLERGAIGPVEFLSRAKKLGYEADDAALIMEDCLIAIDAKRNAAAQKRAKEEAAAAEKEARRQQQAINKANQLVAQAARANEQRRKTGDRRQKQLLSATEKAFKKCDCTLADVTTYMKNQYARVQVEYALSKDEALIALISAVDSWIGGELDQLTDSISLSADLVSSTEAETSDTDGIVL